MLDRLRGLFRDVHQRSPEHILASAGAGADAVVAVLVLGWLVQVFILVLLVLASTAGAGATAYDGNGGICGVARSGASRGLLQ